MSNPSEPFDQSAKIFYSNLFSDWGLKVETEREVFHRGRTIDLVVGCPDDGRERLSETVFAHFRRQNALEFKGHHDPLASKDYNRIVMRAWALGGMEDRQDEARDTLLEIVPHPSERTVTIVCVTRPSKILSDARLGFEETDSAGVYCCAGQLGVWIIHPTELALTPRNYPLLTLTRGEKLAEFIDLCLKEDLTDYLQLILDVGLTVDPQTIWKKMMEASKMRVQMREETWTYIDRFFQEMPEAFGRLPTFRGVLEEKERQGIQQGRQQGIQQGIQQGMQQGIQQERLDGIKLGLELKFGAGGLRILPEIREIDDVDVLRAVRDGLKTADTLAELRRIYREDVPDDAPARVHEGAVPHTGTERASDSEG